MTLSSRSTVDGLTLRTEPEIIAPNGDGEIIISYSPKQQAKMAIRTMLIIEGVGGSPSERMITVTIEK
jgi:hypothetical protein